MNLHPNPNLNSGATMPVEINTASEVVAPVASNVESPIGSLINTMQNSIRMTQEEFRKELVSIREDISHIGSRSQSKSLQDSTNAELRGELAAIKEFISEIRNMNRNSSNPVNPIHGQSNAIDDNFPLGRNSADRNRSISLDHTNVENSNNVKLENNLRWK